MDINRIRDTLVKHEGLRLDLYQDHLGIYTVGVGHNIQERGISERVDNECCMGVPNNAPYRACAISSGQLN